jgi:hypothetical protein
MSAYHRVVFIYAVGCPTVTHIVLSTSCNLVSAQRNTRTCGTNYLGKIVYSTLYESGVFMKLSPLLENPEVLNYDH